MEWGVLNVELYFMIMTNEECWVRSYVLLECGMRSIKCGVMFYWNDEWEILNEELYFIGMWNGECWMSSYILMNNGLIHNFFTATAIILRSKYTAITTPLPWGGVGGRSLLTGLSLGERSAVGNKKGQFPHGNHPLTTLCTRKN